MYPKISASIPEDDQKPTQQEREFSGSRTTYQQNPYVFGSFFVVVNPVESVLLELALLMSSGSKIL
jgi:hypothetical protein